MIAHYTTLIPFGLDDQLQKLEGWYKAHGGHIHTVNHAREFAVLAPQLPDWVRPIEVRFPQKFGRDYVPLTVLMAAIRASMLEGTARILIANSDIEISRADMITSLIDPKADLVFASRNDVDDDGKSTGRYTQGYDVFSLLPGALGLLDLRGIYLGMPWWDYVLPLSSVMSGRRVRRLDTDAFRHRIHPQRWSLVGFNFIGWEFMKQLFPGSVPGQAPSNSLVMEFAKVSNQFLNNDMFLARTPPNPGEACRLLQTLVAEATGLSLDDDIADAVPNEANSRFWELHSAYYALYQESLSHPNPSDLAARRAKLDSIIAESRHDAPPIFDVFSKLVALRTAENP